MHRWGVTEVEHVIVASEKIGPFGSFIQLAQAAGDIEAAADRRQPNLQSVAKGQKRASQVREL